MRLPIEDDEQAAFVQWWRLQYPQHIIFAIPNGGKRSIKTAVNMKRTGTLPGVPDLFVPSLRLWVEMKRQKGGALTEEQKKMIGYLEACGYTCIVAKGCADAIYEVTSTIAVQ